MATTEQNALIRAKDAQGNSSIIYPITKAENVDGLEDSLNEKANTGHVHDDRYYTETEIDSKLSGKSDTGHTHDDRYYTETEIDSKLSGKSDTSHGHAISDVTGLQTALDGKAASSHGTHVTYSTTAPAMDGTASAGTASTVARSDHKHPIDTSRAAKTDLDSHTSDTTVHITSTERTNWNAAKTHADSAHAPSDAEKNQNAFSNVVVGSTTIAADSATDTLTFVAGNNITLTPDATNDKVTIAATDTVYTHPSYTARTGVPTANQTPAFGGTFTVSQPVSDSTGHITAVNSRTITIPSTAASTSAAGLMSASDKSKLDGITESADAVSFTRSLTSGTKVGTITINGSGTDLYAPTNTDTHYASGTVVNSTATSTSNTTSALTNGNVYVNHIENGVVKNSHKISGSGATKVTSDESGNIVITSTDTNLYYVAATASTSGLMSASDKSKLDGIDSGANAYSLPTATSSTLGGVKTGSNITNSSGTINITKDNVTAALGYTPPTTNTTYTSLKNPYAVTIQANGTSLGTYDGSSAKTFNITASNVGADASGAADTALASAKSYTDSLLEPITTSGDGSAYTATVSGITALTAGVSFTMIPHVVSASTQPTLNVNGLGAKYIRRRLSTLTGTLVAGSSTNWLTANKPIRMIYDGTFWVVDLARPSASDIYGSVPITSGGTGGTSAEMARANLGAMADVAVTSADAGKFLRVSSAGVWAAESLIIAEEVSF